jgi:hypothetical protein
MRDRRVWTLHGVCDHVCRWAHDPFEYHTARAHQNLRAAGGGRGNTAYPSRLLQYDGPVRTGEMHKPTHGNLDLPGADSAIAKKLFYQVG